MNTVNNLENEAKMFSALSSYVRHDWYTDRIHEIMNHAPDIIAYDLSLEDLPDTITHDEKQYLQRAHMNGDSLDYFQILCFLDTLEYVSKENDFDESELRKYFFFNVLKMQLWKYYLTDNESFYAQDECWSWEPHCFDTETMTTYRI